MILLIVLIALLLIISSRYIYRNKSYPSFYFVENLYLGMNAKEIKQHYYYETDKKSPNQLNIYNYFFLK